MDGEGESEWWEAADSEGRRALCGWYRRALVNGVCVCVCVCVFFSDCDTLNCDILNCDTLNCKKLFTACISWQGVIRCDVTYPTMPVFALTVMHSRESRINKIPRVLLLAEAKKPCPENTPPQYIRTSPWQTAAPSPSSCTAPNTTLPVPSAGCWHA